MMLLEAGAAVDATTKDHYTPVHIACKEGHLDVLELLIDQGADLSITTKVLLAPPLFFKAPPLFDHFYFTCVTFHTQLLRNMYLRQPHCKHNGTHNATLATNAKTKKNTTPIGKTTHFLSTLLHHKLTNFFHPYHNNTTNLFPNNLLSPTLQQNPHSTPPPPSPQPPSPNPLFPPTAGFHANARGSEGGQE